VIYFSERIIFTRHMSLYNVCTFKTKNGIGRQHNDFKMQLAHSVDVQTLQQHIPGVERALHAL
jgi:hypothetical protein